jgi:hypothetical protein
MEPINALIALLALILAIITVLLQRLELRRRYVRLALTLEYNNGDCVIAHTKLENALTTIHNLVAVFLLVSPEEEDPVNAINRLFVQAALGASICCPIDLHTVTPKAVIEDKQRLRRLIPLLYYTEENINVADELLAYSSAIDVSQFPPGRYSVRLYVYGKKRLYRVVQALLVIPSKDRRATPTQDSPPPGEVAIEHFDRPACKRLRNCPIAAVSADATPNSTAHG